MKWITRYTFQSFVYWKEFSFLLPFTTIPERGKCNIKQLIFRLYPYTDNETRLPFFSSTIRSRNTPSFGHWWDWKSASASPVDDIRVRATCSYSSPMAFLCLLLSNPRGITFKLWWTMWVNMQTWQDEATVEHFWSHDHWYSTSRVPPLPRLSCMTPAVCKMVHNYLLHMALYCSKTLEAYIVIAQLELVINSMHYIFQDTFNTIGTADSLDQWMMLFALLPWPAFLNHIQSL